MRTVAAADYASLLREAARFVEKQTSVSEVIVLGPTRDAADDFARLHLGEVAGVHRFTVTQLAAALAAAPIAERGLAPVNRFGMEALAARAAYTLQRQGQLRYFDPVVRSPGFAKTLARTLQELRLERVDRETLAETSEAGEDLAALLELYQGLLAEGRLADLAEMLRLATQEARSGRHRFARLPLVLLDVPLDSRAAQAFCEQLGEQAAAVLSLTLDTAPPRAETALGRLRSNLFVSRLEAAEASDDSLEFFSAAGEGLECIEIARRVQRCAESGIRFDEQAILLRSPERYQPLLEEALTRAGIPHHFTHGSVRPDPAGRAFLALLVCAAENYTATRFAEYLSLGQAPAPGRRAMAAGHAYAGTEDDLFGHAFTAEALEPEPEVTTPTPAAWEKLIVDAAVVGGRDRWRRRLEGLEAEFRLRLAHLEDEDESGRLHLKRQLELLGNLQRLALPIIECLDSLPKSGLWSEWLESLSGLASLTLRDPASVLLALNELWPMGEVGPVSLPEVILVLSDRLRFLRRPPAKRRYGQVWIGTIDEARAQSFHVVFLPGLAEGIFPRKQFEDPLLLDEYRLQVDEGLPRRDTRVAEERQRLRIAGAVAARRLVVSYPRIDVAQGRPRVPSFYAMEVVRAAEGRLPELRDFERRAAAAALTRLGWPAPEEPSMAVDALEYDLAVLQSAFEAPRGEARGAGRYLFSLNPHLGRSLRQRPLRWGRKWSTSDGLMSPDEETLAVLGNYRLSRYSYSASTLQLFSACPYRFLLHGIHRVLPREEAVPLEEMDPLTRGSIFHAVLFEIAQRLRAGAGEDLIALVDRTLDEVAAKFEDDLAPAIPRVWKGEIEDLRADLHGWARRTKTDAAGWELLHAEYAFGLADREGRDPASTKEEARLLGESVLLRGSIDWLERHTETGFLRITDFKTGRIPQRIPRHVGGGAVLQPLLYALAADHLLGQPVKLSRLYYATQRGAYEVLQVPVTDEAKRDLKQALQIIDEAVATAHLPAAPQPDGCRYCDYRPVCGPREEERTGRKQVLPYLVTLRSMP